jgi:uncharacterized protein YjbI with pentapeptide repeats
LLLFFGALLVALRSPARRSLRVINPNPASSTDLPPTAAALVSKAKDLEALRSALVDAAGVSAGLWFSYLFVMLYLLIAVGGVTHRDLLLESPVKLPFLGVDLPLTGFFWLGPALFLILHAYVLIHFVLLAGKVGVFHAELQAQVADEDVRARLRRQLPSNIFVQFLAGPREIREGVMGLMLRSIADISLAAGPVLLLIFFQFQFLPYHEAAVTWWHRIAIVIDLGLLWTLWPSIRRGETVRRVWRNARRGKVVWQRLASLAPVLMVFTIATVLLAFTVATFPGERLHNWRLAPLHKLLVGGEADPLARKTGSIWSNRLVLPGFDVIDRTKLDTEAKIAAIPETLSLRTRNLEGAVLINAILRKVDFTAANLEGANFRSADLGGARLWWAKLQGAEFLVADLQGAEFFGADLRGANLWRTFLGGANLEVADLKGANLQGANLEGANLGGARLGGANLEGANLQGVNLQGADLRGANLNLVQLQSARLKGSRSIRRTRSPDLAVSSTEPRRTILRHLRR